MVLLQVYMVLLQVYMVLLQVDIAAAPSELEATSPSSGEGERRGGQEGKNENHDS